MKSIYNGFVIAISAIILMSCVNQEKHYSEMAIRASDRLEKSSCKDCFWGIEVFSRGNIKSRFRFTDSKKATVAHLDDTVLTIESIYFYLDRNYCTRELDTVEMKEIALCFKDLDIRTIRGIETDTSRYLLCDINDCVTLYYIPDMSRNSPSEIEWFKNHATEINKTYYYVLHKENFEFIYGFGH